MELLICTARQSRRSSHQPHRRSLALEPHRRTRRRSIPPLTKRAHPSQRYSYVPATTKGACSMAPGSGAYCHVLATQHPVETARTRESASLDSLRFHVATTIWQDVLFELYCYTKRRSWQKLIRGL